MSARHASRRARRQFVEPGSRPTVPARPATLWCAALIVAAGMLAYGNSFGGPFIFDDSVSVVTNASLRDWSRWRVLAPPREVPTSGRPLVNLTLALNYAADGLNVGGYHAVNLALHLVCGLLVFACVRRTLESSRVPAAWRRRSLDVASAAALLWTVHPLNSEVVDYITQRTESMMAAFFLGTIYANARSLGSLRSRAWQSVAVVSCALGMGCKESMVTAPVVVVLHDAAFTFESLALALRARWRYYALLLSSWLVLIALNRGGPRAYSAGYSAGVSAWTYLLNQTVMIVRYLRLAVWPDSLVLYYGVPRTLSVSEILPYAFVVLALVLLTLVALRRWPLVGFAGAWFFITLAPTSSIVPIATEVGAERRMYLPLVALVALVAAAAVWAVHRLPRPRIAAAGALLVAAAMLIVATRSRNREYTSPLLMAQTVVERWPGSAASAMVGQQLAIAGRHDEAIVHLRAATRGYAKAHYHLGGELFNAGRLDEAIPELEAFLRDAPLLAEAVPARTMLGRAFMKQEQWRRAEQQLRMVLTMAVPGSEAHTTALGFLADTLFAQQRFEEAAGTYRTYLTARPGDAGGLTNLGVSLAATGSDQEALAVFRRALALNPRDPQLQRNVDLAIESLRERR